MWVFVRELHVRIDSHKGRVPLGWGLSYPDDCAVKCPSPLLKFSDKYRELVSERVGPVCPTVALPYERMSKIFITAPRGTKGLVVKQQPLAKQQ